MTVHFSFSFFSMCMCFLMYMGTMWIFVWSMYFENIKDEVCGCSEDLWAIHRDGSMHVDQVEGVVGQ